MDSQGCGGDHIVTSYSSPMPSGKENRGGDAKAAGFDADPVAKAFAELPDELRELAGEAFDFSITVRRDKETLRHGEQYAARFNVARRDQATTARRVDGQRNVMIHLLASEEAIEHLSCRIDDSGRRAAQGGRRTTTSPCLSGVQTKGSGSLSPRT